MNPRHTNPPINYGSNPPPYNWAKITAIAITALICTSAALMGLNISPEASVGIGAVAGCLAALFCAFGDERA